MGRNQQQKGGYARKTGTQPDVNSTGRSGRSQGTSKAISAATALGLGVPSQNAMLASTPGLQGTIQLSSIDSLFGSTGLNPSAGVSGLNTGLSTANSGTDILQLAALLGGSQQQSVSFQPAQPLQVRQALAQQQASQVVANQAALTN